MSESKELVTVTVDGTAVQVPKGTNLIEVARKAGVEIPHYCYHPNLSIAGNCRMCQVQVEGMPKLTIACNTGATDGMVVRTQKVSEDVAEAQRATLEFLLINHPLDCTVCDQAGHCKLQDYYYEYNGRASRFVENKVNKIKAEPVGPEVIYDGERCIVCTRCVRFCEEVTETSEFGVFNRGDKSVIGIHPGAELDNPFSGVVVDLCPVGALTHRRWRFNTRIWYTQEVNTVCTGCSTGCNAKVAVRDGKIVQVKARLNEDVNKEWMCDEGRYGFDRFQPKHRVVGPIVSGMDSDWTSAVNSSKALLGGEEPAAVLLSPFLTLEEVWVAMMFARDVMGLDAASGNIAMQLRRRDLSKLEQILVSPDYAPNARAAQLFGLCGNEESWREAVERHYESVLKQISSGSAKRILLVGEGAVAEADCDAALVKGLRSASVSLALCASHPESDPVAAACSVVLPGRTVHEKNGVMLNRDARLQRLRMLLQGPIGTQPEWMLLANLASGLGKKILPAEVTDDRGLFRAMTGSLESLSGATLVRIGDSGIELEEAAGGKDGSSDPAAV
ncbi:MAG: (2Fe-2S)-binding protein [Bdellovibrionales bacterium]|nr:(2Fe-2S)-binding protein [Bdellovibrionales bacterium]